MKSIFYIVIFCFIHLVTSAQLRVHFMSGLANYKGDIQQKEITLLHAKPVHTIGATYNIDGHLFLRLDFSSTKFEAYDWENKDVILRDRNLSFKTNLAETALLLEYDLLSLYNYKFTPYFFSGLVMFKFNPYTADTLGNKLYLQPLSTEGQGLMNYPDRNVYKLTQFGVPLGAGIKYALSDYVWLAVEYGTRKLFTDYLDDVSKGYIDENVLLNAKGPMSVAYAWRGDELKVNTSYQSYPNERAPRGNPNLNDNYYFGQVKLSIRLPWFESEYAFERSRRIRRSCPRF